MEPVPTRIGRPSIFGLLLACLLAAGPFLLGVHPAVAAATFTVNRLTDQSDPDLSDGRCDFSLAGGAQCTLRAAIEQANATAATDTIAFDVPGGGVHTIRSPLARNLPTITQPVIIDGYTQPGSRPNTAAVGTNAVLKIELVSGGTAFVGLRIEAPDTLIRGLIINADGSTDAGIEISGGNANDVRIAGCFIGTDATGTVARDTGIGVLANLGADVTIGGPSLAARNLLSGNRGFGVWLNDFAPRARVIGNLIGTDKTGAAPLPNGAAGIVSYAPDAQIGGTTPDEANTIAFNTGDGVLLRDNAVRNRILRNRVFSNGDLGIDLNDDGRTANDPGDADAGPNGLQNKPTLDSAATGGGTTTVEGRLNSVPNTSFVLRFYSNPNGGEEGKVFRGELSVSTNGAGFKAFAFPTSSPVPAGETITATATRGNGDTSEFSAPTIVERQRRQRGKRPGARGEDDQE